MTAAAVTVSVQPSGLLCQRFFSHWQFCSEQKNQQRSRQRTSLRMKENLLYQYSELQVRKHRLTHAEKTLNLFLPVRCRPVHCQLMALLSSAWAAYRESRARSPA